MRDWLEDGVKVALSVGTVESYAAKKLLKTPTAAPALAARGMRLMERGTALQVANRPERGMWMAHPAASSLTQKGFALHQAASALPKTAMSAFGEELEAIIKESFQTSMYSGPLSYGAFKQQSSIPPFRVPPLAQKMAGSLGISPPPPMPTGAGPAGLLAKAKHVGTVPNRTTTGPSINQISKPTGFGVKLPGAGKGNTTI